MSEFNLDLGQRVLEQITLNPELHDQKDPSACVMGWTVRLGGEYQYWCYDDITDGAKMLGISHCRAAIIYIILGNRIARWELARLVHKEERRRYRRDLKAGKRAARIEEETQRSLDLQVREQVRAAKVATVKEKEPILV